MVFTPTPEWAVALTASYTQRPPTYVELFADGPHAATGAFEIGNEDLGLEESFALDLTVRKRLGRITGTASAFYYHFRDFISVTPTGVFAAEEEEEALPVFVYRATDANFFGGEVEVTFHLIEPAEAELATTDGMSKDAKTVAAPATPGQPHRLDLTLRADYVWAEDTSTGRSLPRITPFRAGAELVYAFNDRFLARVEGQYSARQNRTAEFELPTDSFFLLNAGLSYKVPVGGADMEFYVRGTNLLDEEARLHTSFLKDIAPLPGRGVLFGVRAEF